MALAPPKPDCSNRDQLSLVRKCDPYAVKLIYVAPDHIRSKERAKRRFIKRPQPVPRPSYPRRLSLQELVEDYIRYEERLQNLRTGSISPYLGSESVSGSLAGEKEESKTKSNTATLADYLGDRDTESMLLRPAKSSLAERFLKLHKKRKTRAVLRATKPSLPKTIRHVVKAGETLIGLARRYKTSSYDIRRWNNLKRGYLLHVGERLTIHPGRKSTPEQIREGLLRETYGYYKVKKGDTLLGISRRFNVNPARVRQLNSLSRSSHIRIGQKLMLPLTQKKIEKILKRELGFYTFKYTGNYRFWHRKRVVATAYTSHRHQTDNTPFLAAWNNKIKPGMKIIAVSHDLIRKYGLTNGTKVKISGLRGFYTVRDKMNARLRNHIDIYMGTDRYRALRWGRRRVMLYW